MRRLVLGDATYRWRVSHRHGAAGKPCAEVLTVYLEGRPRGPVRVVFADGDERGREYVERSGVVVDYRTEEAVNLHEPGTVRALVERALAAGWTPATAGRALELDGWPLLRPAPI